MSEWYEEWFNEDYLALYAHRSETEADAQVQHVLDLLALPTSTRILDLACGAGRHVKAFCSRGFEAVGIDLSPTLVRRAQSETDAHIEQRDMRYLENLGTFGLVTSFFTSFGYLPSEADDRQVLVAVASVLGPGGYFVLDTVHPTHLHLVGEEELEVNGQPVEIRRFFEGKCVVKEIHFKDRSYREQVRLYDRHALEAMCHDAGLHPTWWESNGDRQLLVVAK